MRSCRQRAFARRVVMPDNIPRNVGSRGASQIAAASLAQIGERFVGEFVQTTGRGIILELPVPSRGIELGKPRAKPRKFLRRQLLDGTLDFRSGTHTVIVALWMIPVHIFRSFSGGVRLY